jgi:REP element-mobilizing transposase RayT
VAGEHYHLYNRGHNYDDIFRHREDYLRFIRLMNKYLAESSLAEILAYCLMPNHFHIFIRLLKDRLSPAMQSLSLAYARGFNLRYGRVGALFQAPFQAIHVQDQEHFSTLIEYIHSNPVEAGLATSAETWEYSSCRRHVRGLRGDSLD